MGVYDSKKAKLKQEIEELRKKLEREVEVDGTLNEALSQMRDKFSKYWFQLLTDHQRASRGAVLSPSFQPVYVDKYGENCEKAVAELFGAIEKGIENGASEYTAKECVNYALRGMSDVESKMRTFYHDSETRKTQLSSEWIIIKRNLEKLSRELNGVEGITEKQFVNKENELRRIEKSELYGIGLDQVDMYESYLTAVKDYNKAVTGVQLREASQKLYELGDYFDSKILLEECDKKLKITEEVEKAEQDVAKAKQALFESQKNLTAIEKEIVSTESKLKNAQAELLVIETAAERDRSAAIREYNNKCNENEQIMAKLHEELSSFGKEKREAEVSLGKTFFLAFKKKKQLANTIELLESRISDKKKEIETTKEQKQYYLDVYNSKNSRINETLLLVKKQIKDTNDKLVILKHQVEKDRLTVSSCEEKLEKAERDYKVITSTQKQTKKAPKKGKKRREAARQEAVRQELARQAAESQKMLEEATHKNEIEALKSKQSDSRLARITEQLEKWYPEHKVYAMDSIDSKLREKCSSFAKEQGVTVDEFLNKLGFELISREAVYELRGPAKYAPGNEPQVIKAKVDSVLRRLNEAYPNKVIEKSIQAEHKSLGQDVSGVLQWLGYRDVEDFLTAYGYKYGNKELGGGRPKSVDSEAIIIEFQKKYPSGSPFKSADELFAGTEYESKLKTIKNCANDVFGMPLGKYLLSIGLIQAKAAPKTEKKKNYIICKVLPTAVKTPIYCIATSKSIHEGDNVEVPMGIHDSLAFGLVQEVINCDEDSAPCDVDSVKTINRKLGVREYTAGLLGSILRANAAIETSELISSASVKTFSVINSSSAKVEGSIAWACCRGLAADVISVLDYLVEKDNQVYEYNDIVLVDDGISELYVYGDDVLDVLVKFPEVKMVMFSENSQSGKAHLCYSKSGYATVTDTYVIGECDAKSKTKWTLKNSPTDNFDIGNIKYTFKFSDDWEDLNYVFTDESGTRKQLGK